jgi:YVTN family beta-propeller protein
LLVFFLLFSSPAVFPASLVYVTNSTSNTVAVVDIHKGKVIATIPVGKEPFGLAFSPDAGRVYVANTQSGQVSVVDTSSHRLLRNIRLDTQLPVWVAVSPDGSYVYVTNEHSNDIAVIAAASNAAVARVPAGRGPAGILVSPDGRHAYVANEGSNNVFLVDLRREQSIASIPVGLVPQGLAISRDGRWLYVANFGSDSVSVIAASERNVAAEIPVALPSSSSRSHGPVSVAAAPDGKRLYTGNFKSGTISVIDLSRRAPVAEVPIGPKTFGVAADPDGEWIVAVSAGDRQISVLDAAQLKIIRRIALGNGPYKLAILPEPHRDLRAYYLTFFIFMLGLIGLLSQAARSSITTRNGVLLAGIFLLALGLRLAGLNWGIPQYDAATARAAPNLRVSFHMDEDKFLWNLTRIRPRALDFYVSDFHWGTLQYYLIEAALLAAQFVGLVSTPWRQCFLEFRPGQYTWLFVAARATSAILGSGSILLAYAIGKKLWSERSGIWAALTLALIPLHVVNSHYLTPDINMTFFLLLAFYFLVSSLEKGNRGAFLLSGIAFGLAVTAKYNAVFLFPVILLAHFLQANHSWAKKAWTYAGMIIGFAAGEPYAFIHGKEFGEAVRQNFLNTVNLPPGAVPPWFELIGLQLKNLALFGIGVPLALATMAALCSYFFFQRAMRGQGKQGRCSAGLRPGIREPGSAELPAGGRRYNILQHLFRLLLFVAVLSFFVSALLIRQPMLRYMLPVIVLGALPLGHFLSLLARRRWGRLVSACLISATGFISFLHVGILTREHTVNQAHRWIDQHVPPGASLIKGWPKIPVINPQQYRVTDFYTQSRMADFGQFFLKEGKPFFPDYVLLDNLPTFDFPAEFLETLSRHYVLVADFRRNPQFWKFAFPQWGAPHDWKYSHPEIRIYRKRPKS